MDSEDTRNETGEDLAAGANWEMFEKIETLGNGAFGRVYKVKCLQSTRISSDGNERVLLSQKSIKKTKTLMQRSNVNTKPTLNQNRSLLQDNFYVIKEIDVTNVPEEVAHEALGEIEIMGPLESPYIVGYFDSFIDDKCIDIIIEYCPQGDLNSLIEKQKIQSKPFVENLIWKIFIHIALGLQYLHDLNIIHRDLKTLNIFMLKESQAKIGDLGCAKKLQADELCDQLNRDHLKSKKNDEHLDCDDDGLQRTVSKTVVDIPEEKGN